MVARATVGGAHAAVGAWGIATGRARARSALARWDRARRTLARPAPPGRVPASHAPVWRTPWACVPARYGPGPGPGARRR